MIRPTEPDSRKEYKFNIKIRVMRWWSAGFGGPQVNSTFVDDARVARRLAVASLRNEYSALLLEFEVVD